MSAVQDQSSAGSVEDLQRALESIRTELQTLQQSLLKATQSSRTAVESEHSQARAELLARQKLWDQQDAEWQRDRQAHQQRLVELEEWFTKQLTATEQNALRALNELDSAWQRDKQQWQESAIGREKESRDRETAWLKEIENQKIHLQELEEQNADYRQAADTAEAKRAEQQAQVEVYVASLQTELESWKRDKDVWQRSLAEQLQELHQREAFWEAERQKTEVFVQTLQQEIVRLQGQLSEREVPVTPTKEAVETTILSLENQIAALNNFVRQMFPIAAHPMRRKTDMIEVGPTPTRANS